VLTSAEAGVLSQLCYLRKRWKSIFISYGSNSPRDNTNLEVFCSRSKVQQGLYRKNKYELTNWCNVPYSRGKVHMSKKAPYRKWLNRLLKLLVRVNYYINFAPIPTSFFLQLRIINVMDKQDSKIEDWSLNFIFPRASYHLYHPNCSNDLSKCSLLILMLNRKVSFSRVQNQRYLRPKQ